MVRHQVTLIFRVLALLALVCMAGCAQLLLPPLRVVSCSLDAPGGSILVSFSAPPAQDALHKAFSANEDGKALEGSLSFSGNDLRFFPVNGIQAGREYVINISTVAEDQRGNSLEKEFRLVCSTKTDLTAPGISAVFPADESTLTVMPENIRLSFTEAVDPHSLEKALQISPPVSYAISWEADYRIAYILPLKPLSMGTRYTLSVSTSLQDNSRNTMTLPFSSTFLLGDDRSAPEISLTWHNPQGTGVLVSGGGENSGLPLDAELDMSFSRDIGIESLAGFIELQPSLGISIQAEGNSRTHALIRFTQRPLWGSVYTLIIRRGIDAVGGGETEEDLVFSLVFNAPEFMPPEFLGGSFKNGTENMAMSTEQDFDILSLDPGVFPTTGSSVPTEICFVFSVTAGTSLSLPSAMEAFSLSTSNSCVYISIKTLRVLDSPAYRGSNLNDPTLDAGEGKEICALVYGVEVENTVRNGLIVFSLGASLKDLLGNALGETIKITWNKI